jgi:low molecular weight phosphotyrosine protein phosphatase
MASESSKPVSVLFVCLGNICRSPMAEGVFRHITHFETSSQHSQISTIDSCGTAAYHTGDRPDSRTMSELRKNGITTYKHAARAVQVPEDFQNFDYILAMDESNYQNLREMAKRAVKSGKLEESAVERVKMFGQFGGKSKKEEIDDPYYGGQDGFETAYEQALRFGKGLLKHIEEEAKPEK